MTPEGENDKLAPLPVRLLVYAVLVAIAVLAIRVIDGHVMARVQSVAPATSSASPDSSPVKSLEVAPADGLDATR